MTTITLTGIDEKTELDALEALTAEHIRAEWGVLWSAAPDTTRPRYPRGEFITDLLKRPALAKRVAVHFCGSAARALLFGGLYDDWLAQCQRIQINGKLEHGLVRELCQRWPELTIITQHNAQNRLLYHLDAENHSLLFDESGGAGIKPAEWALPPIQEKAFGYAGGLGPLTIQEEARRIGQVGNPGWWVDMESHVRTDDWFDLDKAQAVLTICRGLKPLGGEFWMHHVHGCVAVLGYKNGHCIAQAGGRQRALEMGLLAGRLCLRPEGFYLEDPLGRRDTFQVPQLRQPPE